MFHCQNHCWLMIIVARYITWIYWGSCMIVIRNPSWLAIPITVTSTRKKVSWNGSRWNLKCNGHFGAWEEPVAREGAVMLLFGIEKGHQHQGFDWKMYSTSKLDSKSCVGVLGILGISWLSACLLKRDQKIDRFRNMVSSISVEHWCQHSIHPFWPALIR